MRLSGSSAILVLLALILLAGCCPPDVIQDYSRLKWYVGREITVEGCLNYVCPEARDAVVPDDCFIALQDPEYTDLLLDFEAASPDLRDELESYYPAYPECIRVVAKGTLRVTGGDPFRLIISAVSIDSPPTPSD